MRTHFPAITAAICALVFSSTCAMASNPFPTKDTPAPKDLGVLKPESSAGTLSLTLPLKLRNAAAADALLKSISDKTSANYHQFLTPAQFRAQFGASDDDVASVAAYLATYGLNAQRSGATALKVTGSREDVQRAFKVTLHDYLVAAHGGVPEFHFQAPATAATMPAEISAVVAGVLGLNTRPAFAPHYRQGASRLPKIAETAKGTGLINPFGSLTVADFDEYYDVTPLSAKGITGKGRTIGIVTLANFTPSDALKYWKSVGLKVSPDRIKVIAVDGGAGPPSDASGSGETALDVEQSGGVAPGADIIVYQAPNTDQAFVDAFVEAVESNKADSISTSWGEWEWFDNLLNAPVTDPYTGKTVSDLTAFHQIFLQAALQGQTLFAASGDSGAYDANDGMSPPDYSLALSVDSPASDPYITAAGGTTLPGKQTFSAKGLPTLVIDIPKERVWSWDYLEPLCAAPYENPPLDPVDCGIFPVGSGGGVSFESSLPFYQAGISGVQKTASYQSLIDEDTIPPTTILDLPAGYVGRNVPDVSFNADPYTGYELYYTSDQTGFSILTFNGGTSFVGPQLNGVIGLIGQYLGHRIGLLNVPLYEIQKASGAHPGKDAPLRVIDSGNNDYYDGRDGYSPAVGVGTLDVSNFAEALKTTF
jgi:subtilase family serine protease